MEHSWRLSEAFVRREVAAVRAADPGRPVMMNGFLPTSTPVRLQQWWRTRDQGDSLSVAQRLADIVGIDFYPRHALASAGPLTVYLDGSRARWQQRRRERLLEWAAAAGRRLMIAEGQAEPWEAVTTPPSPAGRAMYSCRPEDLIRNYSQGMRWRTAADFVWTDICSGGLSTGCCASSRATPATCAPSRASWRGLTGRHAQRVRSR